jgi:hypothetical protein
MMPRSVVLLLLTIGIPCVFQIPASAQSSNLAAEAEAAFVEGLAAWGAGDVEAIASSGGSTAGFGFRSLAARGTEAPEAGWSPEFLESWFVARGS